MPQFTCPDCGHQGEPADVETAALVDGVLITCEECGVTTIQPVAFASARREEVRK